MHGLASDFASTPSTPGSFDRAHDRLANRIDVDVLDANFLLHALTAVTVERRKERDIGARRLRRLVQVRVELRDHAGPVGLP